MTMMTQEIKVDWYMSVQERFCGQGHQDRFGFFIILTPYSKNLLSSVRESDIGEEAILSNHLCHFSNLSKRNECNTLGITICTKKGYHHQLHAIMQCCT